MKNELATEVSYRSDELKRVPTLPTITFYYRFFNFFFRNWRLTKRPGYDYKSLCQTSTELMQVCERSGAKISISGLEHLHQLERPPVILANHMSSLDGMLLPAIINHHYQASFVIKESAKKIPVFKDFFPAVDPIPITRENATSDLFTIYKKGSEHLKNNISIVIFPQSTRTTEFISEQFSSIAVRLAKKTKAPLLPLALKTDMWANGKIIKDFGRINPRKTIHFEFGEPVLEIGNFKEVNSYAVNFIQSKLRQWEEEEKNAG